METGKEDKEIKKGAGDDTLTKAEAKQLSDAMREALDKINETKQENEILKDRITSLEQRNKNGIDPIELMKAVKDKFARVTFVDGMLVFGYANKSTVTGKTKFVYEAKDPDNEGKRTLFIDLKLRDLATGKEKVKTMRYVEYHEIAERLKGKIIDIKTEQKPLVLGLVESKTLPEGDKFQMESGDMVPDVVMNEEKTYTLQVEGIDEPIVLDSAFLNI